MRFELRLSVASVTGRAQLWCAGDYPSEPVTLYFIKKFKKKWKQSEVETKRSGNKAKWKQSGVETNPSWDKAQVGIKPKAEWK